MYVKTVNVSTGMNQPDDERVVIEMSREEAEQLVDDIEKASGIKVKPVTALDKLVLKLANKLD